MSYNIVRGLITPDTTYVRLRWYDPVNLLGSTAAGQVYRGNSAFDPDMSGGTSTQPAGFDNYAQIYSHYQVIGSSVKIQFTNLSGTPARLLLIPTIASTNPGINAGYENPYAKIKVCGGVNGNGNATISSYMKTKKLYGRNTSSLNFAAAVGANPANQWFWHLRAASLDLTDLDLDGNVIITYFLKFFQRNILADA